MRLLILVLLLVLALSESSYSGHQQQTFTSKQDYLDTILGQLASIKQSLSKMKSINQNANDNAQLYDGNEQIEKVIYESTMEHQQQQILEALSHSYAPISSKPGACQNIQQIHQKEIIQKLRQQQVHQKDIEQTLRSLKKCQRSNNIIYEHKLMSIFISGVNKQMTKNCIHHPEEVIINGPPFMKLKGATNYPNTQTDQPYILGNLNKQTFDDKVSSLQIEDGAVACPFDTPFLNQTLACSICQEGSIYNISSMECIQCPKSTTYDPSTHKCSTIVQFSSNIQNITNYVGQPSQELELNVSHPTCPSQKPFFSGIHCTACSLPFFYNFTSNKCTKCQDLHHFNSQSKECQVIGYTSNIQNGNYIGLPPTSDLKLPSCPTQTPYYNGKYCIECSLPQFFDFGKLSCSTCSEGQNFDLQSKICKGSFKRNSNLAAVNNFMGQIVPFNELVQTCSSEKPFFNDQQCIQCKLPHYFDFNQKKCTLCQQGLQFITQTKECMIIKKQFYTNLKSNQIYFNGNFKLVQQKIQKSKKNKATQCPQIKPFYDTTIGQCIDCPSSHPLFHFKKSKCMKCNSKSTFSYKDHICIAHSSGPAIQRMIMNWAS